MNKTPLNATQPCIPSLTTSWSRSEMMLSTGSIKKLMMPAQHLSVILPFYVVFLQLMQQMIITGPLRLDHASTLYTKIGFVLVAYHPVPVACPLCRSCISPCSSCFPRFLFLRLPHVYKGPRTTLSEYYSRDYVT